jgi:sigma-B regulation protein RsbU (phosphoserine phosphatase)
MGIRAKLLILLLIIALGPLIVVSWLQNRATARLGDDLATEIRKTLADNATLQLRQLVDDAGLILKRDRELVEQALRTQAREADNCLAAEPPRTRPRVYFSSDYDLAATAPPGMVVSPKHYTAPGGAEATPLPVDYDEEVFKLAPGVKLSDVADDVARLAKMVRTYQFLTEKHAELFYWNHTCLENGVHSSYPGHGGYPADYDPRRRLWYQSALRTDDVVWTGPMVDASSHRILMTVAMRLNRPDGSIAGVTAIDVPLSDLLARVKLPAEWAAQATVLLVRRSTDPRTGEPSATIIAQQDYRWRERPWEAPISHETLESADTDRLRAMLNDMQRHESGVQEMAYKGRRSLWAYGLMHEQNVYLVVVAPYDVIVAEAVSTERYVLGLTLHQLELTGAVLASVVLIVIVLALIMSRRITSPVHKLVGAARQVADGDFSTQVRIRNRDELGEMGQAFNAMVPQLQDSIRMRQSLALAMQVQRNLLPQRPPLIDGLDVAGLSLFCDETGGDYYDFLNLSSLGPNQLGVAVGDVTGHGISAALLMATTRALLRSHAIHPGDLGRIMADINEHLTADTLVGQFTTLFYAVLDGKQKTIRWSSAGHDPAIIYSPATGTFDELGGAGIPLGIEAGATYQELNRNSLQPGEIIVIGTDGVWETHNGDGEPFGKDALRELIRRHADGPAEEIAQAITKSLAQFRQSKPQEDDVTLVVIKIT